ncbi:MAG: hypothetical protein ACI4EC_04295, partial [Lachnospiraceae bacterium]
FIVVIRTSILRNIIKIAFRNCDSRIIIIVATSSSKSSPRNIHLGFFSSVSMVDCEQPSLESLLICKRKRFITVREKYHSVMHTGIVILSDAL